MNGFTRRGRRLLALVVLLPLLAALPAAAAGFDIDTLLQSLAKTRAARATFTEKKYLALLGRPLESSGQLRHVPPGPPEKPPVEPKPETLLVDGDTVVIERGRQRHTLQLQEFPELAGFIDSIRGTLAGDRRALERSFRLKLDGSSERWTLTLTPTAQKLLTTVHLIEIAGVRDNVRSIQIVQTDGDRALMTIERIAAR